ncbi:hypothetical protein [Sporomusa aerivorans]|uniref:hypothetical protein n=1 Tax=Sporomusa aerivorans TaxID=204936 RepID=UPI00352B870D
MLKPDFQDLLVNFIYINLPALMNPESTVVIVDVPTETAPSTTTIEFTPEVLAALKTYVFNNFDALGLPPDIQTIVSQFFAINNSIS